MAYQPTGNITAQSAISQFQSEIRDYVNNISGKWSLSNNPTGWGGDPCTYSPQYIGNVMDSGDYISGEPASISEFDPPATMSLANIQNLLRNSAALLTNVRYITLIKTYNSQGSISTLSSGSNFAHMITGWRASVSSMPTTPAGKITGNNWYLFMQALYDTVNNDIHVADTFTEAYCHSNCHSNHSSRNRR